MPRTGCGLWTGLLLMAGLTGCHREAGTNVPPAGAGPPAARTESFLGSKGGDEHEVAGIKLSWCPAGRFLMGSPPDEPERRPGEDQVEVTLTKGFWMGKYEVTQGQWERVIGKLPGEPTAELPEGDDFPVGNVNFAEAEAFCHRLTEIGRQSGVLPNWLSRCGRSAVTGRKRAAACAEPNAAPDRGRHSGFARQEGIAGGPGR